MSSETEQEDEFAPAQTATEDLGQQQNSADAKRLKRIKIITPVQGFLYSISTVLEGYYLTYFLTDEAVPKLQFWNSNLGFKGKSGAFDRFFQELVSKPTGFWNKLRYL